MGFNSAFKGLRYTDIYFCLLFYMGGNVVAHTEEKHWLRVFEKRTLRTIFGPNRNEGTGEWRELYNEEFNDMYSSPGIIRENKLRRVFQSWHVTRMGGGAYRILVET